MADTGYTFWNKEIDRLKDGKSKEEREQIDRTINMASSLFRKHNGK